MKIPTSFECLGTTYSVTRKTLPQKYGHFDPKKCEIVIHKNLTDELAQLTFWHEFMHCALYTLSYKDLWDDEELVERLGQVTHQMLKTAQS